ncbi:hypothetical protein BJV77DRAFT_1030987, partial [Russula vinacea]
GYWETQPPCQLRIPRLANKFWVCSALGNVLPAVKELTLDLDMDLLLPFIIVKKLHIGSSLALELSKALKSVPEALDLKLLPKLQELDVRLTMDDARMASSAFLHTRRFLGRPVALSVQSLNYQRIIMMRCASTKAHQMIYLLIHSHPAPRLRLTGAILTGQDQSRNDDRWTRWLDPPSMSYLLSPRRLKRALAWYAQGHALIRDPGSHIYLAGFSPASVVFAGIGVLLS